MLGKQKGKGAEIYLGQRHTGPWKRAQENSLEKCQETNRSKREKSVSLSIFVGFLLEELMKCNSHLISNIVTTKS